MREGPRLDFRVHQRETEGWTALLPASADGAIHGGATPVHAIVCEAPMPPLLSAPEVLNREFLEIRCKILELAAAFDRLERADGSVDEDPRLARLREAMTIVLDQRRDRAEQVQMLFSREYDDDWQQTMKIAPR